jgi:hypothetical protein
MIRLGLIPLLLLAAGVAAAQDAPVVRHTVKSGETLISICQKALPSPCDWHEVQRLNGVTNPMRLVPGQVLQWPAPPPPAPEEPFTVDLVHAHGQVTVDRQGSAASAVVGGAQLRTGDTVRTGSHSSASMRFPDGSRLVLHSRSAVVLERLNKRPANAGPDTQLRLQGGTLDTHVQPAAAGEPVPRLQIRTQVANLGVRGTDFRTRFRDGVMSLEVLQGRVEAAAVLSAASAASAAPSSPPVVAQVSGGTGLIATPEGLGAVRALPAAPHLQSLPVLVQHLPLLLDFTGTPRASRWSARVSAPGAPDQPLLEGSFSTPMARWPDLLPDGTYELRVRAADETGLEGADAIASFVLKARPLAPVLKEPESEPASAAIGAPAVPTAATSATTTARVAWQAQPEAATYQVQVADDTSFTTVRAQHRGLTATALEFDLSSGRYFWRAASVRADGIAGPWSESRVLVVKAAPAPPPPAKPAPAPSGPWWPFWLPLLLWLL